MGLNVSICAQNFRRNFNKPTRLPVNIPSAREREREQKIKAEGFVGSMSCQFELTGVEKSTTLARAVDQEAYTASV